MQRRYKELFITDEMEAAREAKKRGEYVVLSYPVHGMTPEDCLSDFPYAVETGEEPDENYLKHVISRFRGEPCHILDTERCTVREITVKDVDRLYEIYAEPQITEFMENLYENREEELAYTKDYIRCHYAFYDFGMWIVQEQESGRIIGRAGFDMRPEHEIPELGFMICRECQNRGYAEEVCRALLIYGRQHLGFERVSAFTHPENTASRRLLQKLGFSCRGEEVRTCVKGDKEAMVYYEKVL